MDRPLLLADFRDNLDFGMVELCLQDTTCAEGLAWTGRHHDQGFAWREGIVGFSAPETYGPIKVQLWLAETAELRPNTARAVRVPFTIPANRRIYVSCGWGIPDFPPTCLIPAGNYAVTFTTGYDPSLETEGDRAAFIHGFWCDLIFVPAERVEPAILVADDELTPKYPLLMEAKPIQR